MAYEFLRERSATADVLMQVMVIGTSSTIMKSLFPEKLRAF